MLNFFNATNSISDNFEKDIWTKNLQPSLDYNVKITMDFLTVHS